MNRDENSNSDQSIESLVNRSLDASIENISPDIKRRLNQIRMEAIANKRPAFSFFKLAATTSFVLMMFLGWQLQPTGDLTQNNLFADLPTENLEMLDDLEFYYWMSEEAQSASL